MMHGPINISLENFFLVNTFPPIPWTVPPSKFPTKCFNKPRGQQCHTLIPFPPAATHVYMTSTYMCFH